MPQVSTQIADAPADIVPETSITSWRQAVAHEAALEAERKREEKAEAERQAAAQAEAERLAAEEAEAERQAAEEAEAEAEAERLAVVQAEAESQAEAEAEAEVAQVASSTFEATAYTADCKGCSGITASGYDVRSTIYAPSGRRVIAADPSVLPMGAVVVVTFASGASFEAEVLDRGGAIKGHRIDLLVTSYDEAIQFGRQAVQIHLK